MSCSRGGERKSEQLGMAESTDDDGSELVDVKHAPIPGFFAAAKDTESPTSPLDFGGLAFSPRSNPNKWFCDKVGLSLLSDDVSFTRDTIVLKAQLCASLSDALDIPSDSILQNLPCSSSSPVDIIPTREMALSEDYTCIISHGPNPKTTHIFGDCILDCDPKEFGSLGTKEDFIKPQAHDSLTHASFSRQPHHCHIHRSEEVRVKHL